MIHQLAASFNSGELSPLMDARVNVEKYNSGCRRLRNFVLHTHGPVFRRPGTQYMGEVQDSEVKTRLLDFSFSATTNFVIEMGVGTFRFWSNGQLVMNGGVPLEVTHPYLAGELFEVQAKQINDVVYFTHPNHWPHKLTRLSDTQWLSQQMPVTYPPLLDEYVEKETIGTPTVTEELNVETREWPEYDHVGGDYSFLVFNSEDFLSATTKTLRLQKYSTSTATWTTLKTITWTTSAASSVTGTTSAGRLRITYSGPAYSGTLTYAALGIGAFPVISYHLDDINPDTITPATVPAGEWQARMICVNPLPSGVGKAILEKKVGSSWVAIKTFTPIAGQTIRYDGTKLAAATDIRMRWSGRAMMGGSFVVESLAYPPSDFITMTVSDTTGTNKTLTASKPVFNAGHVGAFFAINHRRETSFTELVGEADASWATTTSATVRVSGKWDFYSYGIWSGTVYLERLTPSNVWEVVRTWKGNKDRNIIASGEQQNDADYRIRISGAAGEAASGAAVPRFLLESADSRSYGLVKITSVTSSTIAVCDVIRTVGSTAATTLWAEGAWSDYRGYPAALALHQGRLWFGGTAYRPQGLWASVSGDFENFRRSTADDGSIAALIASDSANGIRWMSSAPQSLLIGTTGEEWSAKSSGDNGIITPVSLKIERQSGYSSNSVPARIAQDVTLFVQRDGRRLRQLLYDFAQQSYAASDLTVLASHVTDGGITQIAFQQAPTPIVWCVTGKGRLIGMTFEREQNVFGWHVHVTDGLFESVAVIPGTPSDEVWLVVKRTINGEAKRYVERFTVRGDASDWGENLVYSDSAKVIALSPASATVTGLDHLEGKTVQVVADGAVHPDCVVSGGSITLDYTAETVIAGIRYDSVLQLMKSEAQLQDGTAQGRKFKLNGAVLKVNNSLGGDANANPDDPQSKWEKIINRRVATPMDARPPLYTGDIPLTLESRHESAINLVVRQSEPLPFNLVGLVLKYDVHGI